MESAEKPDLGIGRLVTKDKPHMTKRRPKPSDPMRYTAFLAQRKREADDRSLLSAQPDVQVSPDSSQAHQRLDVFSMLHQRRTLTSDHLLSARRLEADILAHRGLDLARGSSERVDASASVSLVTDRMLDAGIRVARVLGQIGGPNVRLITAIMDPLGNGRMLGRGWRQVVKDVTGCVDEESLGYLIRSACQAVFEAYMVVDNSPRTARTREDVAA